MQLKFQVIITVLMTGLLFTSCKKSTDDEDDDRDCELTVAAIAGKYKIIAAKLVTTTEVDVLDDIYDPCEKDDINELRADKTFTYSDAGTKCSPDGTESGTWDVRGRLLILNSGTSNIESFNCKDLVVTYRDQGGNLIKETYRRQ